MSSSYLPEEVVLHIFSCLQPKPLFRFKSVCKTWNSLIGNPDLFSSNALNRSILRNPNRLSSPLLFVQGIPNESGYINYKRTLFKHNFYFLSNDTLDCQSQIIFEVYDVAEEFKVVASCNGLLCLFEHIGDRIYLWNPASSEPIKSLPRHPHSDFLELSHLKFGVFLITVGFGFDRTSNDFKVLRICNVVRNSYIGYNLCNHESKRQAELYTLSTRTWRVLDVRVPFDKRYSRGLMDPLVYLPTTASDGVFFWWLAATKPYQKEEIVAFDFNEEVFRTTLLPNGARFSDYVSSLVNLAVINGCLAIIGFPRERKRKHSETNSSSTSGCLVIWILFEFGVKETWTKLVSIPLLLDYPQRPLWFWRNGGLILENEEGELVLYNLLTHEKKVVLRQSNNGNNSIGRQKRLSQVFPYTSSMITGRIELNWRGVGMLEDSESSEDLESSEDSEGSEDD